MCDYLLADNIRPYKICIIKQQLPYKQNSRVTMFCILANCLPDHNFPFSIFHFTLTTKSAHHARKHYDKRHCCK